MREFTTAAKTILQDRYLSNNETIHERIITICKYYGYDEDHSNRMMFYILNHWFMPSTPILSNGGTNQGLPISCFLNSMEDTMESIIDTSTQNKWISHLGGGIGTSFSNLRSTGEDISSGGKTGGVIPHVVCLDSDTRAISQGKLRRGSAAAYIHYTHPEILEFLNIRKLQGGGTGRKVFQLNHGITIDNAFLEALESNKNIDLISPKTKQKINSVPARDIWQLILTMRMELGEPYIVNLDTVNDNLPKHHVNKDWTLKVLQSNLCSEIMLPTGIDYMSKNRTAVCCLGSVNLKYYRDWVTDHMFIRDCMLFLDNVLQDFINKGSKYPALKSAIHSSANERSIGLGAMGLHTLFQDEGIPFKSKEASALNIECFRHIKNKTVGANRDLASLLGPCQDWKNSDKMSSPVRFSYTMAVAPTANISIIAGECSPCIEPISANIYSLNTLSGTFTIRNSSLKKLLETKGKDTDEVWSSILENSGSVQHLKFLNKKEKELYLTAMEIDQNAVVDMANDRAVFIDQGQSVNLFLKGDIDKKELHDLHIKALGSGKNKSLYYLRSGSIKKTDYIITCFGCE
ncbi:hypothetical protein AB832_07550 [Flavobacteriaceae bacterium (ex Bugula neritina AB1)]|nr:hypothetical protein AB832_07550 [Flavobacteriaceae bacterium (ex Bugula neritina AB1)]